MSHDNTKTCPVKLACLSEYVAMRDGVCLAVSAWRGADKKNGIRRPAVVMMTRYWRAMQLLDDKPELQSQYAFAEYLYARGYILVVADARGSGASFGSRETEIPPSEVEDFGELIHWVSEQAWCDGRVASTGTSYTANTTLCSLVTANSALKIGVCRAPDVDCYRYLLAPGGIPNHWFLSSWGMSAAAQDRNDTETLFSIGYWPIPAEGTTNILGVRPVDSDSKEEQLTAAVVAHQHNFNLAESEEGLTYFDNNALGSYRYIFDPVYKQKIEESNIPLVIRCGWHDAGTQLGVLAMFNSFNAAIKVIIGPWNHGGDYRVDPFYSADETYAAPIPKQEAWADTVTTLDHLLQGEGSTNAVAAVDSIESNENFRCVEYYTLGANRWCTANHWPPECTVQRWYLAANQQLSPIKPEAHQGSDIYRVSADATTGLNNRWHAQSVAKPVLFPDRQYEDQKLQVYDSGPFEQDVEITGHPVVCLYLRSSANDGQFFAYLEAIDPEGRVYLLTEGQLRGLHHKISEETPPYTMFGPYHSLLEKDSQLLTPGELVELSFDLFPLSIQLQRGWRIRLAIAGADKDTFAPIAGCETPEITIERNANFASYMDVPFVTTVARSSCEIGENRTDQEGGYVEE